MARPVVDDMLGPHLANIDRGAVTSLRVPGAVIRRMQQADHRRLNALVALYGLKRHYEPDDDEYAFARAIAPTGAS